MATLKKIGLFFLLLIIFSTIFYYLFKILGEAKFSINLTGKPRVSANCYCLRGFPFAYKECGAYCTSKEVCACPISVTGSVYGYWTYYGYIDFLIEIAVILISTILSFLFLKKYIKKLS